VTWARDTPSTSARRPRRPPSTSTRAVHPGLVCINTPWACLLQPRSPCTLVPGWQCKQPAPGERWVLPGAMPKLGARAPTQSGRTRQACNTRGHVTTKQRYSAPAPRRAVISTPPAQLAARPTDGSVLSLPSATRVLPLALPQLSVVVQLQVHAVVHLIV
jgi:hypothetical protein